MSSRCILVHYMKCIFYSIMINIRCGIDTQEENPSKNINKKGKLPRSF